MEEEQTLYVLSTHLGSVTKALVDAYQFVRETPSCWIVREAGRDKRLLKSANSAFRTYEELSAEIKRLKAAEISEMESQLKELREMRSVRVHRVAADFKQSFRLPANIKV